MRIWHKILHCSILIAGTFFFFQCASSPQRTGYNRNTASYQKPTFHKNTQSKAGEKFVPKNDLEEIIKPWLGTPYLYGGTSRKGIDCSGFVLQVFRKYKGIELPHSTREAWKIGKRISKSNLQKGDVLFFGNFFHVSHNAIYLGDGKFAHSSSSKGVSIANLSNTYWAPRYKGARRY